MDKYELIDLARAYLGAILMTIAGIIQFKWER